MKKHFRKSGILLIAVLVVFCSIGMPCIADASATVKEAQQKKEQLQDNLKEAQNLIKKLENNKGDIEEAVKELDEKLTGISSQISDLEEQLEKKSKEIQATKNELKSAKKQEKEQYESMCKRIRFMYENSGMSYLEALLGSDSFADFLNRAEYISRIVSYDRAMLAQYQETKELIANSEIILKKEKEDLESMQGQLQEEKEAVNLLLKEKEKQLSGVQAGISDAENEAARYKAEIEAENQIIQEILAAEERARQLAAQKAAEEQKKKEESEKKQESEQEEESEKQEEAGKDESSNSNVDTDNSYTGGVFAWPCPSSRRITSGFGYRDAPTAGASSYHQGLDIGAAYGAAIVAAADGVVTSTGYSNVLGNYVILSHGGGLFTVYFHCSSVLVSSCQNVERGQTIAKVGSTGISTGNHLHFGVQLNGSYVDPMNYL